MTEESTRRSLRAQREIPTPDTASDAPVERVLVVCTGNIIRSPFIAGLLASQLPPARITFASVGTGATPGARADDRAAELAAAYGVDLTTHAARKADEFLLGEATSILCATKEHRRRVLRIVPSRLSSVFTVREFATLAAIAPRAEESDLAGRWRAIRVFAAENRGLAVAETPEEDDIPDPHQKGDPQWWRFEEAAVPAVIGILGAMAAGEPAWTVAGAVGEPPGEPRGGTRLGAHG